MLPRCPSDDVRHDPADLDPWHVGMELLKSGHDLQQRLWRSLHLLGAAAVIFIVFYSVSRLAQPSIQS